MEFTGTDTRYCRKCGAAFKRSPADTTVNCPDHRKRTETKTTAEFAQSKLLEAKMRGYAARKAGDREAEAKATEDLLYWRSKMPSGGMWE